MTTDADAKTPLQKARRKYDSKRIKKTISLRPDNEIDQKIISYIETIDFSNWVKQKILDELSK